MSEDSLDLVNSWESTSATKINSTLDNLDTDSYISTSPSPGPDAKKKTFDFSMIDTASDVNNLSAALQVEQEFLDFMFSLPQIQKEANDKKVDRETTQAEVPAEKIKKPTSEITPASPMVTKRRSPKRTTHLAENVSRVGLDHLDNLCRMMEQLGDLKEKNTRLQRRVQYLEDLKTLQEMHKDMQSSIDARKQALSLGSVSLSDYDLRLEELNNTCLYRLDSEDSLNPSVSINKSQDQLLDLPESSRQYQRYSSSEDDHRLSSDKDGYQRPGDKEKKIHKSAWGKVKHMISKRENTRKKSSEGDSNRKEGAGASGNSTNPGPQYHQSGSIHEVLMSASDPEEYDFDYESLDPDAGGSWEWDMDAEGGIWMGPKSNGEGNELEGMPDASKSTLERKQKPSLKITVPSSENLRISPNPGSPKVSSESAKKSPSTRRSRFYHSYLSSQPSSPAKKTTDHSFNFDNEVETVNISSTYESDTTPGLSPELSPDEILTRPGRRSSKVSRDASRHVSLPASAVHKNLVELQRTLTGEFNKKLQEWEKLKNSQGIMASLTEAQGSQNPEESLPHDFKKKLHEWEKIKGKDKLKTNEGYRNQTSSQNVILSADDSKMKKHDEDDLPPDFKKKLTEWEIRKALVGKGQQNVEKWQKNLGEEFNKKMEEWEKMKAVGQVKMNALDTSEPVIQSTVLPNSASSSSLTGLMLDVGANEVNPLKMFDMSSKANQLSGVIGAVGISTAGLDRKGSASKVKKLKSSKFEKPPLVKAEQGQKTRDKELVWLEKELNKIDKEKQRLEREKEKFLEREARLEKMRQAMKQGPAENKEIYIKTSTGEFRFEGISQTFTKKLYEWEERRGIRPESSTFVLLDPNYKAPEKNLMNDRPKSPDPKRIVRSRSESSIAEMNLNTMPSILTHQSSLSLNEIDTVIEDSPPKQDHKCASEPTLLADETEGREDLKINPILNSLVKIEEGSMAPCVQGGQEDIEDVKDEAKEKESINAAHPPYAPSEITKLIDSSGSEDNLARRKQEEVDEELTELTSQSLLPATESQEVCLLEEGNFQRPDIERTEESYRCLLHENMTLLGKLKEQETLCRALETQMGDIDTKMDSVADQHLRTLERLQVTILKKSESSTRMSEMTEKKLSLAEEDEVETNQRLLEQLKARIMELEIKGDRLMEEKEELEHAFKLHKDHETQIAESLLLRIRELQDAGAEVNIQTVPALHPEVAQSKIQTKTAEESHDLQEKLKTQAETTSPSTQHKKRRRKRRDEWRKSDDGNDTNDDEDDKAEAIEKRKLDKELKDKKKKKTPPKKVQKLHSLTADLLFQAKRLEGALVTKHNLAESSVSSNDQSSHNAPRLPRNRSLKGRSSLRLMNEENRPSRTHHKQIKGPQSTGRTWSSIEAIASLDELETLGSSNKIEPGVIQSQELLAMNAELSRMAKELRREMMNLWSFRESTSPESNSSDNREELISKNRSSKENRQKCRTPDDSSDVLTNEAREVFKNIAALHQAQSAPEILPANNSFDDAMNEIEKRPNKYRMSSPEIKDKVFNPWNVGKLSIFEETQDKSDADHVTENSGDEDHHFKDWWKTPTLNKKKKLKWTTGSIEEVEFENHPSRYDDQSQSYPFNNEEKAQEIDGALNAESHETFDFETPLPGQSGTTIGDLLRAEERQKNCKDELKQDDIRVHSRLSTSGSEDERKISNDQYSTIRTEILSSSFEYDEKSYSEKDFNNEQKDSDDLHWPESTHITYPPAEKCEFSQQQLDKVGVMVGEATKKLQNIDEFKGWNATTSHMENDIPTDDTELNNFETEVKPKGTEKIDDGGGLRTRRVSDTQVTYETDSKSSETPVNKDELYKQKYFYFKKVGRIPSIRRNQSESDVMNRPAVTQSSDSCINESDIFVRTHLTLFTVTGDQENAANNTVTPTFLLEPNKDSEGNSSVNDFKEKPKSSTREFHLSGPKPFIGSKISNEKNQATFLDNFTFSFQHNCSPNESKKKLLTTANQSSPAVRNMIEQYNKRITEKQELLINPFTPGDPFTNKKLSTTSDRTNIYSNHQIRAPSEGGARQKVRDRPEKILKSQSAIAFPMSSHDVANLQRSYSGMNYFPDDHMEYETDTTSSGTLISVSNSLVNNTLMTSTDTLMDVETSSNDASGRKITLSSYSSDGEARAIRVKKAKNEFLARGTSPLSGKCSTEFREQDGEKLNIVPSNFEGPTKPPRILEGNPNIPRKKSFRCQSEGCLPDDENLHQNVSKLASSDNLKLEPHSNSKPSKNKSQSKLSLDPSSESPKLSKGLFKLFKRSRTKDQKDLSTVHKLCQQTLGINIEHSSSDNTASSSCTQSPALSRVAVPIDEGAAGSSKTLPRPESRQENPSSSSSKSCPSSPATLRKSKTAKFIEKSKKIFKSRSSSPYHKPS